MSQQQLRYPANIQHEDKRRLKRPASTAACCDGARPQCLTCRRLNVVCQYQESVSQNLNAYQELFRFLATRTIEEATEVLGRIRRGHSVQEVLRHIQDADLLLQLHVVPDAQYQYSFPYSKAMPASLIQEGNSYLDSWLYRHSSFEKQPHNQIELPTKDPIIYQVPYHAAQIVDPRFNTIKAKRWTMIIDDDKLLTKLLQIYFLTEYTWYPAFQKDYFLDDMAAGRKQYCSSLLVNAILASACHGNSKTMDRAKFWNPRTLGYQFLAEARRLWEFEAGNAQLTTIQAAIVMTIVHGANGNDKIGKSYLTQAVSAAHGIQLFSPPTQAIDHVECNARAITAWALFGVQAVHSFHEFKAPLLDAPPKITLPSTVESSNFYGEFWLQYPPNRQPVPVSYGNTFKAIADFRSIMNDVAAAFFSKLNRGPGATVHRIQMFCVQLDDWYRNLPADLTARNICFPWQLKLHMHYHNLSIHLLETLTVISKPATYDINVQKTLSGAKVRLETLLRLYYLRHGYESYDIFMVSVLSFLGFIHIKALKGAEAIEVESRRSAVVLTAQGLRDQSRNCYVAGLVFRVMKGNMGVEGQSLLGEIEDLPEEDEEEKLLVAEQVQASWPIDIERIDIAPEKQRLGNLVKRINELRV
ncbi:hypothetical protein KAF25_000172 [Fusarium avenaceum]|uniref:Xylanolytic transcriptional activator regulatory domain-containing protein n=1 Tax=Fusarium avenaceum TaxID=40199 RepID=A0A9P7GWB2_9HYPO|nr:hypothetical protein KAF25_000172 [Fusarium avenaceum]